MPPSKKKGKGKSSSSNKLSSYLRIAKRVIKWYFIVTIIWVVLYRFVNPPVTFLMVQRGIEGKFAGKGWVLDKRWKDYGELSKNLKHAAIAGEDANFMTHHGFDFRSIQKAYFKNKAGKPVRGGSTISQQTAKNVFLWPGRSYIRKIFEAYFTVLIEIFWSKQRILEVYLNVAEMGDGLYGAEAATQYYFHKSSARLTKSRAALIIAVLPNPRKWSPSHPTPYIYYKQSLILRNMRRVSLPAP